MNESVRSGRYRPRRMSLRRTAVGALAAVGLGDAHRQPVDRPAPVADALAALRARPGLLVGAGALLAFVFALAVRAVNLATAYDLFVDEVTYFFISQSVATGHGVVLHGQPFFLHPPLYFLAEAPYILLTHPTGLIIQQVLDVRLFDALLGAATAVVVLLLAGRVGGWRAGLVAYLLFALDPFIVRIDSRNLIESQALLLVMLGYLALVWGPVDRGRVGTRRMLVVGLCFGAALLSKEMTFFLTLLPIGALLVTDWVLPRRTSLAIFLVAALVYAVYPVGVVLSGLGPLFVTDKLSGLLRFLGLMKTTGFVHGGPSFTAAIVSNLDVFATTYVLIALGMPAALLLVWKGDGRRRILGVLGVSAYALLAYSIGFGTLEEQFFYFLVLPAIVGVPLAWSYAVELERRIRTPLGRVVRGGALDLRVLAQRGVAAGAIVLPVALVVSLGWSSFVWLEVRTRPDDGYRQVEAYLRSHVPQGAWVGVTTEPQEFVLQGYVIKPVPSAPAIVSTHVRYVVISTKQIQAGYTPNGTAIWAWLRSHAQPVYTFDGRTYGNIVVYRVSVGSPGGPGGRG